MTRQRNRPDPASGPARVTASTPGDLLGLVPYLLGFRPSESLVLMLIRDGQVLLTARVDLPPLGLAEQVVGQFGQLAEQHHASGLVLFGYSGEADHLRPLLQVLIEGLQQHGLVDALIVDRERWWSLMCTSTCCPAEGTPYDPSSHPMAAEAVYAGLSVVSDRTQIEDAVSGPPASDRASLERVAAGAARELRRQSTRQRVDLMSTLVRGFVAEPCRLTDEECARLAVLAADVTVRDVAWALITRPEVEDHLDLWGQVVRRTVAPWEAPALCLLGMAAWISGNGALQNCCTDRAVGIDPTYSLAGLLAEINQQALSPQLWDVLAPELRQVSSGVTG